MQNESETRNNKELLEGTVIYLIGSIGTKILNFLIVPMYTYYINKSDMGEYDLLLTIVSLLSPIISLRISEATYNWLIKKNESDEICIKATYNYLFKSSIISLIIMVCVSRVITIWNFKLFIIILILDPILETSQKILRGLKNRKLFAISGMFYTALFVGLNFLSICWLKKGVESLLVNTIISQICTICLIFLLEKRMCYLQELVNRNELKLVQKDMLKYSVPLVPSTLNWWVMNASDRFIIKLFLGTAYNGVYAVVTKFPSILQTIFVLFNNAWTDMALANINSSGEKNEYVSKIFEKMYVFSFSFVTCLIPITKIVTQFILSQDYKVASIYIGFLYLGSVFQGFSAFVSVGYLHNKMTTRTAMTSIIGALVNITINILLINTLGLFAATISTFVGFFAMWLVRMYDLRRVWPIRIKKIKFTLMLLLTIFVATITIKTNVFEDLMIAIISGIYLLVCNLDYLKIGIQKLNRRHQE